MKINITNLISKIVNWNQRVLSNKLISVRQRPILNFVGISEGKRARKILANFSDFHANFNTISAFVIEISRLTAKYDFRERPIDLRNRESFYQNCTNIIMKILWRHTSSQIDGGVISDSSYHNVFIGEGYWNCSFVDADPSVVQCDLK